MIKAVVFDLDGTLLDTLEDLTMATNYSIEKFGYSKIDAKDTKRNIGNGIRNLILKSVNYDETHIDEMFQLFKEYYTPNCNVYTRPYEGILTLLYKLKQMGYKLACVSNKAKYALEILCEAHFKDYFLTVIGDGEGLKKKPDPETLIEASKRLGIMLDEMVYIGDSDVDVKTVINTGCKGIFVSYGYRDKNKLIECGARVIIDSPLEVLDKLKEIEYE